MDTWQIISITLLLSALFSGMEIAFVSANRLKVELDKARPTINGRLLTLLTNSPSRFIGAMLLGNNIALVIYGMSMEDCLGPWLANTMPGVLKGDGIVLFLQTVISTLIILVVAEFIPKVLFRLKANLLLRIFAFPVFIFMLLFYPVIRMFTGISELLLKWLFKKPPIEKPYHFTYYDLDQYLRESAPDEPDGFEHEHEFQMLQNVMDFRHVKVRECLVPRNEIVALEEHDSVGELSRALINSGHSKILIYRESVDNIIGYAHAFDLFSKPKTIQAIVRPVLILAETTMASKALERFFKKRQSMAVVVDEYGGTSGIVTVEDLIEEIFGEINDEFDTDELVEKVVADHEYVFAGRLEIDYLNEKYRLELPESEDYETLAGYLIHHCECIPHAHEVISIPPYRFEVVEASEIRVEQLKVTRIEE